MRQVGQTGIQHFAVTRGGINGFNVCVDIVSHYSTERLYDAGRSFRPQVQGGGLFHRYGDSVGSDLVYKHIRVA